MNKKILAISLVLLVTIIGVLCIIVHNRNEDVTNFVENEINLEAENKDIPSIENNIKEQEKEEVSKVEEIYIKVNNHVLNVKLEDNDSTKQFVQKLKENDITVDAQEYGEFEKVGDLGFELPRDDKNIKTDAGDIVLYQGNQISVFYGSNSWSYTKLGKIQNLSKSELKDILGDGNVRLTFSLDKLGDNISQSKTAVIYFSATGTTKDIATKISNETKGDLIEIEPKIPYTSADLNYNSDCRANREQNDKNARPEIKNNINVEKYDTIYLGYPIWWGTNPKIILTFLDSYNLSGKTVIPFCTSGSSGISQSEKELKEYNNKINWKSGKRFSGSSSQSEITSWINQ